MQDNTRDTKSNIFNTALKLFAGNGYENVSVRDIADKVGIKAASIYNHFESKEKILEACYNFYLTNRYHERPGREQYESIVRNGTKEEILDMFVYPFEASIHENMVNAVFVIYSRVYSDIKAREIYASEINDSMQFLKEVFNFGVEIGRIHPFNVPTVSLIILSTRVFTGHSAMISPEQKTEWRQAEENFMDELVKIVPFKY